MNLENLVFLEPFYLRILFLPALLFVLWLWQVWIRKAAISRYHKTRNTPIRVRHPLLGRLSFWLLIILATTFSVLALSRPAIVVYLKNTTSIDVIVIQDGSASTRVKDVKPDRWQRSISFLRTFTETLRWNGDRLALALFAYRASPFIRLTDDPNVVVFFLDHIKNESLFPLYDNKTWHSNVEEGIYWGVKILIKDEELYGRSKNPRAFLLVSDGSEWSGDMEKIFKIVKQVAPVYVVGVGTTVGGFIPDSPPAPMPILTDEEGNVVSPTPGEAVKFEPVHSSIDRTSLRNIALTTGGKYFELGTEPDTNIAVKIINSIQQQRVAAEKEPRFEELYWYLILTAGFFVAFGILSLCK